MVKATSFAFCPSLTLPIYNQQATQLYDRNVLLSLFVIRELATLCLGHCEWFIT